MAWLILLIEIFFIFLTSRFIFKSFFVLVYIFLKSQKLAVGVVSFFFFPGVVIHELSHLICAGIVGVKTHGIEFFPELHEGRLKMGSVKVEQSDFFRQFLIGIAPFISGVTILSGIFYLLFKAYTVSDIFSSPLHTVFSLIILYLMFVITNTMFSSKKDMEGALELLAVLVVIAILTYLFGLHPEKSIISISQIPQVLQTVRVVDNFLAIPLGLNLVAVIISSFSLKKKGFRLS